MKKIQNYLLEETIGEGSYGTVYKATDSLTDQTFAIKVIPKSNYTFDKLMRKQLKSEMMIMSEKPHPNLMFLHKSFETSNNYYFVLDYCEEGDLEQFMIKHKIKYFKEKQAVDILFQIKDAFVELRRRNIIHRDLKLENIFITQQKIMLGDFGVAKVVKEMTTTTVGTPLNMAPEISEHSNYNHKSDLWSIGVILYKLLVGKPPFFGFSIAEIRNQIRMNSGKNLDFKNKSHFCESTKQLIQSLLQADPEERISWEDFFNHEIFTNEHRKTCKCYNQGRYLALF
jgi:serine/threonine protein kinase